MRSPLVQMRLRGVSSGKHPTHNSFGMVRKYANGTPKPHQGWDLEAASGTPVYAIARGKVHAVLNGGAYGRQVILAFAHAGKTHYAHYAHLSSTAVTVGQEVLEGEVLGRTGASGNASSLSASEHHLHFEIRTIPNPGLGLAGRVDPGTVLGFGVYSSAEGGYSGRD
jgi:murein DD-endopeptidase MepM/ murein hydrolase activator NlpD